MTLLSRNPRAPEGPPNPQNHFYKTIHHTPQVLYIFGILGSRHPPSYIQITIWSECSSDRRHRRWGFSLCEIFLLLIQFFPVTILSAVQIFLHQIAAKPDDSEEGIQDKKNIFYLKSIFKNV